jgi:serine/threonine protein kinase
MSVLTNNYEIIRELGRGGMGTVYLAYDKRLDRQVAIKMLNVDPSLDEATTTEIIHRFQKEAKAIAKLNHPNIVSIYDIGEDKNKYYMVIELLEGQSLSNIVEKKQKLSPEIVISIGVQICGALSYAHKNGIVHRDIKPANIMFSQEHHAKLTDFGIAQLGNDKMNLTQAGSILGSILYIPPEQLMDSRKVDHRADIYSLGATLYQLFTGRLPFEGNTVAEVITKIINQEMPNMRSFEPNIPEILDKVIIKAMKKEPDDRFPDVALFGKALSEVGEYLKNPNYSLDPSLFNELSPASPAPAPGLKDTRPDMLSKTEIIKPPANLKKTQNVVKKNVTTEKLSTGPLRKPEPAAKGKNNLMPIIAGVAIVGFIALIILLNTVFSKDREEENNQPVPHRVHTKKPLAVKQTPVPAKVQKQPQVVSPKIVPKQPVAVKQVAPRVVVQKPVVRVVRPVAVRRPVAQVIPHRPAVVKKPSRPAVAKQPIKKSIGEGY